MNGTMMKRYIITCSMIWISVLCFCITLNVATDGSGDFSNIQAALDAAQPGDSVLVYPGRYYENLIISTNNISLISMEAVTNNPVYVDSTVIDGTMTNPCLIVNQGCTNISIRGLSFTNGFRIGAGGGISFSSGSSTSLTNSKVFGNIANTGGGINVIGATVAFSGVEIFDNYSKLLGGGLLAVSITGYSHTITFDPLNRCSIYNNRSGVGQDILIRDANNNQIIYLDTFSVDNPTSYYAVFTTQHNEDYHMNIDFLNAHHQEINSDLYVSPDGDDANDGLSPTSPLRTIHEGIYRIAADSLSQKTVHLLPGTYSRTANNQVFPIALKSWVKVQGSGMENTLVMGEPHPQIPIGNGSADTVFKTYIEPVVSIADLSITTQNTDNASAIDGAWKGSLSLSNIHIYGIAANFIAAIWMYMTSDYESTWDNVIVENVTSTNSGLVDINGAMKGSISNCRFRNATSTYTSSSVWAYPLVSIRGDEYMRFDNCEFSNLTMSDDDSHAIQVGGVQYPQQQNNFSFNNCLFSNNTSQGGVMVASSANNPSISFTNCTFAGNESNSYTLAAHGNVNINNTIFDNNSPYQIHILPQPLSGETTTLDIDYSNIKNGIAGIQQASGNIINFHPTSINSNPLFLGGVDIHDPHYYSLSSGSPCIDSGTPDTLGLSLLPYDLAGNERIWNSRIDMGCMEYDSPPYVSVADPELPTPVDEGRISVFPNPFIRNGKAEGMLIKLQLPCMPHNQAKIEVYNIRGQRVKSIAFPEQISSNINQIKLSTVVKQEGIAGYSSWDGRDDNGRILSSGVYVLRMKIDSKSYCTKVTMIK